MRAGKYAVGAGIASGIERAAQEIAGGLDERRRAQMADRLARQETEKQSALDEQAMLDSTRKKVFEEAQDLDFSKAGQKEIGEFKTNSMLRLERLGMSPEEVSNTVEGALNRAQRDWEKFQLEKRKVDLMAQRDGGKDAPPAQKTSSSMQGKLYALGQAHEVLIQLKDMWSDTDPEGNLVGARAIGIAKKLGAKTGFSPQSALYKDIAEASMAPFARMLGEVGTLAEFDIQRAMKMVPVLGDNDAIANAKFRYLEGLMNKARRNVEIISSGGMPDLSATPLPQELNEFDESEPSDENDPLGPYLPRKAGMAPGQRG